MLARFREGSIRWQIVTLAVLPVLAVGALGIATEPLFPDDVELAPAEVLAARIDLLADQLRHAPTAQAAEAVLDATRRSGLDVRLEARALTGPSADEGAGDRLRLILNAIHAREARGALPSGEAPRIAVDVAAGRVSIAPPAALSAGDPGGEAASILRYVLLITAPVVLLSLLAAQLIVAPLSRLSAAAQAPGAAGPDAAAFEEAGPREVRRLARHLNAMRRQVHLMLAERTAMLRSVSHDLRTPLTRMRLRVERSVPAEAGALLLRDIDAIGELIDETLDYLRSDSRSEAPRKLDLPSLLQTICSDFADMGCAVIYAGPARLGFTGRPKALSRAVSNLVDNATKHGDRVVVALVPHPGGAVRIEVSDDGPGLAPHLREAVIGPFVKADPARTSGRNAGFGLGLSIVQEIVTRQGGQLMLLPRHPNGLTAAIVLPDGQT